MAWIIEHKSERDEQSGEPLAWSNSEGWTAGDDYETFSDEERDALNLPIDGQWSRVDWQAQMA